MNRESGRLFQQEEVHVNTGDVSEQGTFLRSVVTPFRVADMRAGLVILAVMAGLLLSSTDVFAALPGPATFTVGTTAGAGHVANVAGSTNIFSGSGVRYYRTTFPCRHSARFPRTFSCPLTTTPTCSSTAPRLPWRGRWMDRTSPGSPIIGFLSARTTMSPMVTLGDSPSTRLRRHSQSQNG